jgi:hypothetical protein
VLVDDRLILKLFEGDALSQVEHCLHHPHAGAGTVNGIVEEGPAKVFPGALVALVPEKRRRQNKALYFAGSSDAMGRFVIRGVRREITSCSPSKAFPPSHIRIRHSLRNTRIADARFTQDKVERLLQNSPSFPRSRRNRGENRAWLLVSVTLTKWG